MANPGTCESTDTRSGEPCQFPSAESCPYHGDAAKKRSSHPGSITKRGPSYRVRLCVDGERHYYTLRDVSAKEAREYAREKHRELTKQAKRTRRGIPGIVHFSDLADRYEETQLPKLAKTSVDGYRNELKAAKLFFGKTLDDPKLQEVTGGDIEAFLDWRRMHSPDGEKRKKSLSGRSVEKARAILHRIFELAEKWELRDGNPVSRTDPPKSDGREPVILSDQEYEQLLAECRKRDPMLYLYALTCGGTGPDVSPRSCGSVGRT